MRRILLTLVGVAALAVAGCGSSTGGGDDTDHNAADVMFLQMMIPHHEQAVEMSELAATRAESADVKALATQIEAAQQPEIDRMTGWLEDWGEPTAMHHMGGDTGMDGMLTDEQLAALENAGGAEFDRLYLTGMIQHHEGAVEMANDVLENGSNPDVADLATAIVDAQTREIDQMRQWIQ